MLKTKAKQIKELETEINFLQEAALENQMQITDGFLSIITHYSKSFELLNAYDTEDLTMDNLSKDIIYTINYKDVKSAIENLKENLIKKGEASDLFGSKKDKSFEGVLGSISQTVFGELAVAQSHPEQRDTILKLIVNLIKTNPNKI